MGKHLSNIVLILSLPLVASACAATQNLFPATRSLPGGSVASLDLLNNSGQFTKDAEKTYTSAQDDKKAPLTKDQRDQMVGVYIAKSDALCSDYFSTISATERGTNTVLNMTGTAAHLGGLIADGTGAKTLWNAYGIGATGLAGDIKDGVFRGNEATILMSALRKYRNRQRDNLLDQIDKGELQGYTFGLLIPYIEDYHSTCTLSFAISEVGVSVQPEVKPTE